MTAADTQLDAMSDTAADDTAVFMDSSVNESPYFVHEPSANSGMKKSARVSLAAMPYCCPHVCVCLSVCRKLAFYENNWMIDLVFFR